MPICSRTGDKPFDPRYLHFFELFGQQKFFEAHEILESLWRGTTGQEREFYQGLIQLAVALVHFQRANFPGTGEMFKSARRHLEKYPSPYLGLDLEKIFREFEQFFKNQKDIPNIQLIEP